MRDGNMSSIGTHFLSYNPYSARNVAVGECIDIYMYAPGQEKPEVNEMLSKSQASSNRHALQQINRSYIKVAR